LPAHALAVKKFVPFERHVASGKFPQLQSFFTVLLADHQLLRRG